MAAMGRPKLKLVLAPPERRELQRLVRRRKTSQSHALRAQIVLSCAKGIDNRDVAEELGISPQTVGKWRRRFIDHRLDGLYDEPRPGGPRKIDDEAVEEIVELTLHGTPPGGATHWSASMLAQQVGVSASSILRIWRTFGLKPHLSESFALSSDPQFVAKVRDVVGLYMSPPDNAMVLCVDEKSQIQALDRTQPLLPMMPAAPERQSPTYVRHGTTSLFAALDVATGRVIGKCFRRHRAAEFRKFLDLVEKSVPADMAVHLILDNYATHKTPSIHRWLLRHPRFHLHFTPTRSSWLNLVESWFSLLSQRVLKRGVHRSTLALERAIRAFLDSHNKDPKPFVWTKTADEILDNLRRYCERVGHNRAARRNAANS